MTWQIGTSLDDYYGASDSYDVFTTFSGNDTIETGGGTDFVFAGVGLDTIVVGSGTNYVRGGLDSDTFIFAQGASGTTFLRGFTSGEDVIDLSDMGITGMDDMIVRSYGAGTILYTDDLTIHVNLTPDQLTDSDFIFA